MEVSKSSSSSTLPSTIPDIEVVSSSSELSSISSEVCRESEYRPYKSTIASKTSSNLRVNRDHGSDESLDSIDEEQSPPELPESVRNYLAEEKFTVVRYLALSTTCVVYQVLNRAGLNRAAKVIDHLKLPDLVRTEHLPQELKIIRLVRHVNIVRTDAVLTDLPNFSIIIGEYAEEGDLISYLERRDDSPPSLPQIKKWFHQTTNAVHYLHQRYIAHRDIKLDNILLCHGLVAKLADFGFATFCRDATTRERILCDTYCGTTEYQAPETLLCEEPYDGMMADCFSLGVVLHVLCTRKFPFGSGKAVATPEGLKTLQARIRAKEWPKIGLVEQDEELHSLLKQLLNADVEERIRVGQVLEHPWLMNE